MLFNQLLLITFIQCLSWKCQFPEFGSISTTHFLYKEDNINHVKWLERYEYCRAKGDSSVYKDAGKGKCEYSRSLCYWNDGSCLNTNRDNDNLLECQNLLKFNTLVTGLDNGRRSKMSTSTLPKTTTSSLSKMSTSSLSKMSTSSLSKMPTSTLSKTTTSTARMSSKETVTSIPKCNDESRMYPMYWYLSFLTSL